MRLQDCRSAGLQKGIAGLQKGIAGLQKGIAGLEEGMRNYSEPSCNPVILQSCDAVRGM
jgi:hypothetical protein